MSNVLAAALAGSLFTLAATYLLHVRDERRMGGAAERQLVAQLEHAYRVLKIAPKPGDAWTAPGLRVHMEPEQWDRLVARFHDPQDWDQINRVAVTLDLLQTSAEESVELSDERASETIGQIELLLRTLDDRETRWLALRPWRRPPPGRPDDPAARFRADANARAAQRRRARLRAVGVLACVAAVGVGAWAAARAVDDVVDDPIVAADVEAEVREMQPEANLVNCRGSDGADRWTCTTGEPDAASRLEVEADEERDTAMATLVRHAAAAPAPAERAWRVLRSFKRREPPAQLPDE